MSLIGMMLTANSLSFARKSAEKNEKKKKTRSTSREYCGRFSPADFRAKERLQSRNDAKSVRIDETSQDERWLA